MGAAFIQRPSDGVWVAVRPVAFDSGGVQRQAKKLYVMQVDDITNPSAPTYTWRLVHDWSAPTQLVPNAAISSQSDAGGFFARVTWTEAAAGSTEDASNVSADFYRNGIFWTTVTATEDSHQLDSPHGTDGDDVFANVYYSNPNGPGPETTTSHITLGAV